MSKITKPFNKYIINGNITTLILERKNSDNMETIIDTEDLERLKQQGYSWHAQWNVENLEFYATTCIRFTDTDGKRNGKVRALAREIMNVNETCIKVDHINHNTLDNRKCNLRLTNQSENSLNKNGRNSNNKSGYRNVFWNNNIGKWTVSLCKNYKRIIIGDYDDVDIAGKMAEKARQKYYGEYAGKN